MLDLPPPTYKPPTSDARVHSYNSARYYETKSEALPGSPPPASGLSNESMCCFLNSLIQALFYTPDFRSAVYTYADRSESPIVKNIAKLFATLQKTERRSVSTKELTDAFGWGDSQRSYQSDIHELQTVLFDSISLPEVITELYEFKCKDKIEFVCSNPVCKFNNSRGQEQTMTELMLSVSPGSFVQSLKDWEGVESLNGDNKIECDKCKTRSDAKKFQCVTTLPKVLNVCLRRLEFDMRTLTRKRVHDNFEVPLTVELGEGLSTSGSEKRNTYELNSVMIHSGTANGGHYYSYNRYPPNENTHWVKCNDGVTTTLSQAEFKDVLKRARTTVYMMVFTQASEASPIAPIPASIEAMVEKEEEEWRQEKLSFDVKKEIIKVIVVDSEKKAIKGFPKSLMQTQKTGALVSHIAKTNFPGSSDRKFRLRRDAHNGEGETYNDRVDDALVDLFSPEYGRDERTMRFVIESAHRDAEWEDRREDDIKINCIVSSAAPSVREVQYLRKKTVIQEDDTESGGLTILPGLYVGSTSTLNDLKIKLGGKLSVSPSSLYIFSSHNGVPVPLNGAWDGALACKPTIPDYHRSEGAFLCVYISEADLKDSDFTDVYNAAMNCFVYSYNRRAAWEETFVPQKLGHPSLYNSFVKLDQYKTFRDLKDAIKEKEGLDKDFEFHLVHASDRDKGSQIGVSLPAFPDVKICDVWSGKGSTFHVCLGGGLGKSECWVQFNKRGGGLIKRISANFTTATVSELKSALLQHTELGKGDDHRYFRLQCGRNSSVYMKDTSKLTEFDTQRKLDCGILNVAVTVLPEIEEVGEKDHPVNVKVMDAGKRKIVGGGVIVLRPGESVEISDLCNKLQGKYGSRVRGGIEISRFMPNRAKLTYDNLLDEVKNPYAKWTSGPGDVWSNGLLNKKSALRGGNKAVGKFSKVVQADTKQMTIVMRSKDDFKEGGRGVGDEDKRVEVEDGDLPLPPESPTSSFKSLAINSTGKDGKGATTKVSPWRGQHALNRRRERGIMINKLGKTKDANAGIIVPVEDGPETATPETEGQ